MWKIAYFLFPYLCSTLAERHVLLWLVKAFSFIAFQIKIRFNKVSYISTKSFTIESISPKTIVDQNAEHSKIIPVMWWNILLGYNYLQFHEKLSYRNNKQRLIIYQSFWTFLRVWYAFKISIVFVRLCNNHFALFGKTFAWKERMKARAHLFFWCWYPK